MEQTQWQGPGTVRVAVLDTSPFDRPDSYDFDFVGSDDFSLCVSHPDNLADEWPAQDLLRQHGTSIAGVIRTTAPSSRIHLIRVLDGDAKGDLFALLRGLELVLKEAPSEPDMRLEQTVINLSLGYQANVSQVLGQGDLPMEVTPTPLPLPTPLTDWIRDNASECSGPADSLSLALCLALDTLVKEGATVIAAAGNNHSSTANLPAAWDHVLAVGATNMANEASCFSNTGEVWAPGGDGGPDCQPRRDDPDFNVITLSLVPNLNTGELFQGVVGYARWAGSSFAAPVVSGMAACLLENGISFDDVLDYIVNSAVTRAPGLSVYFLPGADNSPYACGP